MFIFCCVGDTHRTSRVEPKVQVCSGVLCAGIVARVLRADVEIFEIRNAVLETYPVDVDVQSSTGLPILVASEKAQNIVEIPTVLEHVICSGDGACGIQSGASGVYVHRPSIRSTNSEAIATIVRKTLMRCCDRCDYSVFLLFLLVRLVSDVTTSCA